MATVKSIGTYHHLHLKNPYSSISPIKNDSLLFKAFIECPTSLNCSVASLPVKLFNMSAPPGC